jgi:hypothetical protein
LHTAYAIYHLARSAGGRTPGSSAAYHVFAGVSDLCVGPIYAYGVLTIRNTNEEWKTILSNQAPLLVFIPALYYTLIGSGGLHVVSLSISLWLGVMFRRISLMPPDLNPLEDRFTSRAHKRNKSSVATFSTISEGEKRLSVPLEQRRRSGAPYETLSRPPSIPFMHTRQGSDVSLHSKRDSRTDLPSRHSYLGPGTSPRNSAVGLDLGQYVTSPQASRGSYVEIPLHDSDRSRPPSSTTLNSGIPSPHSQKGKFTEAWYASESLINRTQQRNRAMMKTASTGNVNATDIHVDGTATSLPPSPTKSTTSRRTYEALSQRYDFPASEESESDSEFETGKDGYALTTKDVRDPYNPATLHPPPNPLRSNPPTPPRAQTPYRPARSSALSEVTYSDRNVSGASKDIADVSSESSDDESSRASENEKENVKERIAALPASLEVGKGNKPKPAAAVAALRDNTRQSSIQPESAFYSKPYGELKPATPPIMVGSNRQVSSGNDYEAVGGVKTKAKMFERRNVSGKIAEEGRASEEVRRSRYSVLNH